METPAYARVVLRAQQALLTSALSSSSININNKHLLSIRSLPRTAGLNAIAVTSGSSSVNPSSPASTTTTASESVLLPFNKLAGKSDVLLEVGRVHDQRSASSVSSHSSSSPTDSSSLQGSSATSFQQQQQQQQQKQQQQQQQQQQQMSEQQHQLNPKTPILLLHGYGSGLGFFFQNLAPMTADSRRVFALDWLGLGASDRPKDSAPKKSILSCDSNLSPQRAVDFFTDSLKEWADVHLKDQKVVVVGHSLGAYLAARFALKYPQFVSKLVLASPAGLPTTDDRPNRRVNASRAMGLIDVMWSINFTPQHVVRLMGETRGRAMVHNGLSLYLLLLLLQDGSRPLSS